MVIALLRRVVALRPEDHPSGLAILTRRPTALSKSAGPSPSRRSGRRLLHKGPSRDGFADLDDLEAFLTEE
jgi:hypothetical protein